MISAFHLLWIVPLSAMIGGATIAVVAVGRESESEWEAERGATRAYENVIAENKRLNE